MSEALDGIASSGTRERQRSSAGLLDRIATAELELLLLLCGRVDQRETWQALQTQLNNARARFELGDRAGALEAVDAVLAIDSGFLAAHSLREEIQSAAPRRRPAPIAPAKPAHDPGLPAVESYLKLEQRVKRRRIDHQLDVARSALERGRIKEAAEAIEELSSLDPDIPELKTLAGRLNLLQRTSEPPHFGRWLVAALVFSAVLFGRSSLDDPSEPRVLARTSELPEPLAATFVAAPYADPIVPSVPMTVGLETDVAPDVEIEGATAPTSPVAPAARPAIAAFGGVEPMSPATPIAEPVPIALPPTPPAATVMAAAPAVATIPRTVDDELLVGQVLQRYRNAYEGLDAPSARAVWPTVNEAALARAFDSLESQRLTFDACDITVRGEAASATCRGSARYVPKVGSREPRTEPRVWNFTLSKSGAGWLIDSARAER